MRTGIGFGCALFALAVAARAQSPELRIYPSTVVLDSERARTRVVVTLTDPSGITRDVTAAAKLTFDRDGVAAIDEGLLRGRTDGTVELRAELEGLRATRSVTVRRPERRAEVSFREDVVPVLTRAGCNAGSCHGSAAGKNGFKLSLFGYDPGKDHRTLTRELRGRRLDVADPVASLMLVKPTRTIQHKGGKRLELDGPGYRVLRDWIAEGAIDDADRARAVTALFVEPRELVLAGAGERAPLVVTAQYADGSTRDVTELSILSSSSDSTAAVAEGGVVTAGDRGEAFVMARFDDLAEVAQVIVVPDAEPFSLADVEAYGEIDELVLAKLRKLRIRPAPLCDDPTFVRRAYLDVIGRLPTPDETRRFTQDDRAERRALLIDELLARPEFPEVWAAQWAEVLRIESRRLTRKGVVGYTEFLRDAFREGRPFDDLVRELLTASGSNFERPATNFYVVDRDPKVLAEAAAQVFLGIRVQCAQCHNHPFDRWTMDDYYGFTAFFGQIGRKNGEDPRERVIYDRRAGETRNARTGQVAKPRFLGGAEPDIPRGTDRRKVLADWLTSADNPYFAENVANRVWARFFGRGLVDPPDDRRVSNPPSHPQLYERLGSMLVESGFDLRALVRAICTSRTYQLDEHPCGVPPQTFAGAAVRRLNAEQLLDAIGQVTGVPTRLRGLPPGASAVRATDGDPGNRFLDLFGRPRRESSCTCDRREDPTLNQVLHLINGETIEQKIRAKDGRLARSLAAEKSPREMLDELFASAYSRPPGADEAERLLLSVNHAEDPRAAWEDVYWAVLNSKEFLFQH